MRRFGAAVLVPLLTIMCACASPATSAPLTSPGEAGPSATRTPAHASPSLGPPTSSPGTSLASGLPLPACEPSVPDAEATVAFVAEGHAWALTPSGAGLACLFEVDDAGPFAWGPLGDRALLGGLEVKGVAGGPSLAASDQAYETLTWSRPTGTAILLVPADGTTLEKVRLDGSPSLNVTPLGPAYSYLSVTYHPSGEAFAFVAESAGEQSIWMSSNVGERPTQLVFTEVGTRFGAIAFEADGRHLAYAAQHADNHADLHVIDVTDTSQAPVAWEGPIGPTILDIKPGLETGTFAWTTGTTSCIENVAMAQTPSGAVPALPDATGPTRAVGWLGQSQVLVATGGCGSPLDLSAVDLATGTIVQLVSGVSAAAVRTPVPTPPAPLPKGIPTEGSGFA